MASNNFINECKTPAYENRLGKIIIDGIEYNQGNYLTSLSVENNIYNNGTIIGSTYTKSLKFSLINVNKDTQFVGKKALPSVGVKYSNNTTEYIDLDEYTIEELNDEQTKNFTDITGYDALCDIDKPFNYTLGDGSHTVLEYWNNLVTSLGLETETSSFTNSGLIIPANPFINNESNRVVLSEIEKVSCTFAKVEKRTRVVEGVKQTYHVINLVWFNNSIDYEFQTNDYSTLEGSLTKYGPLNCIILGRENIGGENVVMEDDESIALNGEHKILIDAEYFLFNQELREQAIEAIYNKLDGFEYYDLTLTTPYGKPFLEVGNKIRVNTNEGNVYDTYILSHEFTYDGTFKSTIKSPALTEQQEIVKSTESISERTRRTEIMVDKANQKITSLVTDVDELDSKTTQIEQDVNGLSIEVTETKQQVDDLEDSIELFKANLSQENIVIPVDVNKKPFSNQTFTINFETLFKGESVIPTVQVTGNETGVTKGTTSSTITFTVETTTAIMNMDYTYTVGFSYVNEGTTYTASKNVTLILAKQGESGGEGRGISSIDYRYATTTTQNTPSASSVTSLTIPTLSETDKYLWQKETINYTSGNPKVTVALIGVYGDTGSQGPAGTSITITTKTISYQQGDSGTTPPSGTWSPTIPPIEKGKYLWTKTYIKYSDNTEVTSYSVSYNAKDGEDGPQGPAGTSITIVTRQVQYQIGDSGTTAPTGTWSDTVPELVEEKYLWTKTYVKYSDNSEITSYSVSYIAKDGEDGDVGPKGDTGKGVYSITEEYYLSNSKTSQTGGSWSPNPPTWVMNKYLWTRSKIVYENPSSTVYTTPVVSSEWEAVNQIEVGARNLLKKSKEFALTTGQSSIVEDEKLNDLTIRRGDTTSTVTNQYKDIIQTTTKTHNIEFKQGDIFTFSFWVRAKQLRDSSTTNICKVYFYGPNDYAKAKVLGNALGVAGNGYSDGASELGGFITEEWKRFWVTWEIDPNATDEAVALGKNILIRQYWGNIFEFAGWKLEVGRVHTDWSPAPEDENKKYVHTMYSEDGATFVPATGTYPIGKKPSIWQGTYVDWNQTDSQNFYDYSWVDTSQYNRDELDNIQVELGQKVTTSQLQDAIDGITNIVTSSGGTNYVRDSMGILNDGSWSGEVESTNYGEAVGQSAIVINNATFSQTIKVRNGTYTISFKYKKNESIATGVMTATINGVSQTFTASTENRYVQTINVTTGTINISFGGNIDNIGYLYDLMLNGGTEVKEWEQNQNETTTDTVKIGKGIEVKSSSQNTTSYMNADGFRIKSNTNGNDVMKATDKGGWFNQLESNSDSKVNGAIFLRIGKQIWVTGDDS